MSRRWIAGAVMVALSAAGAAAARQQATFRARREIVRIDTLVADRGRPVAGLTASDFQVLDNGVMQEVDLVRADELPINVILALDLSGSVTGERLDHLRAASRALLGALEKDDRAGLIGFSHRVELGAALTTDMPSVAASLGRTHAGGGTALYDATYTGLVLGESDAGRSLLIVFSDGLDTSSFLTTEAVLDTAKRSAAVVYGVAVSPARPGQSSPPAANWGAEAARRRVLDGMRLSAEATFGAPVGEWKPVFLNEISSLTGGSVFEIETTRDLESLFVSVLAEFRHRYLVAYSPQGVAKDGWHRLEVTIKGRKGLTIKARPGYQAGG